jgi:threonine/homoserine/homoserine lactone efflux protein
MMDLSFLPRLMAVHTSATMSPGPNFAIVFKTATEERNHVASLGTTSGVTLGIAVHAALALFGMSALLAQSTLLLVIIKVIAAVYLSYLGVLSFRGAHALRRQKSAGLQAHRLHSSESPSFKPFFLSGLTGCLMNPKAFLYFMTVLPQGMTQQLTIAQSAFTLLVLSLITFLWFGSVSYFFQWKRIQSKLNAIKLGLSLTTGILFFYLSLGLVLELVH